MTKPADFARTSSDQVESMRSPHERERSHHESSRHRKHSHESDERPSRRRDAGLPFRARPITKDDMELYAPVFKIYLLERKDIKLNDISKPDAYARFKSFVHKWNDGELKDRYYDPRLNQGGREGRAEKSHHLQRNKSHSPRHSKAVVGPTFPTPEDLQLQKEYYREEAEETERIRQLEQKAEYRREKERLEELVPRAYPGTRERQQEKRAEIRAAHRAFREKSPEITVSDNTLMGGDDIKADLLRQKRMEAEREARKEENYRMREAEWLKRKGELEKREDATMEMLKKMAQERFGSRTKT